MRLRWARRAREVLVGHMRECKVRLSMAAERTCWRRGFGLSVPGAKGGVVCVVVCGGAVVVRGEAAVVEDDAYVGEVVVVRTEATALQIEDLERRAQVIK